MPKQKKPEKPEELGKSIQSGERIGGGFFSSSSSSSSSSSGVNKPPTNRAIQSSPTPLSSSEAKFYDNNDLACDPSFIEISTRMNETANYNSILIIDMLTQDLERYTDKIKKTKHADIMLKELAGLYDVSSDDEIANASIRKVMDAIMPFASANLSSLLQHNSIHVPKIYPNEAKVLPEILKVDVTNLIDKFKEMQPIELDAEAPRRLDASPPPAFKR